MTKKERRAQVVEESRRTGKSFEDLLAEKSPERYARMLMRMAEIEHRNYVQAVAKRGDVGGYIDGVHKRLAMSVADQIALDAEYEKRWDAIRTNLRCAGAHGTEV